MAVQMQNLTGNSSGSNAVSRTTALTPAPRPQPKNDRLGADKPFEQILRSTNPARKSRENEAQEAPDKPKRAVKPPKNERSQAAKPKRRADEVAANEPTEQSNDVTSTSSSTEAKHDSTDAVQEETSQVTSPTDPKAAKGSDGDDGDEQVVAVAIDAATVAMDGSVILAGQDPLGLDGQAVNPEATGDGETGPAAGSATGATSVRAIGAAATTEAAGADADAGADAADDGADTAEPGAIRLTDLAAMDESADGAGESEVIDDAEQIALAKALAGQQEPADDSSGQSRRDASADDQPTAAALGDPAAATGGPDAPTLKKKVDQPDDAVATASSPAPETLPQDPKDAANGASASKATTPSVQAADLAAPRQPGAPLATGVHAAPPPVPAESMFAQANHGPIVSSIRHELLPSGGGTMQLRLDPPELGAMQVTVRLADGVVTASFQTSNDDATRLLSHSLHQLKSALEAQGITIDKIQVQQAPRDQQAGTGSGDGSSSRDGQLSQNQQEQQSRNEQQRRELLDRLWRRMNGDKAPIDLVA